MFLFRWGSWSYFYITLESSILNCPFFFFLMVSHNDGLKLPILQGCWTLSSLRGTACSFLSETHTRSRCMSHTVSEQVSTTCTYIKVKTQVLNLLLTSAIFLMIHRSNRIKFYLKKKNKTLISFLNWGPLVCSKWNKSQNSSFRLTLLKSDFSSVRNSGMKCPDLFRPKEGNFQVVCYREWLGFNFVVVKKC